MREGAVPRLLGISATLLASCSRGPSTPREAADSYLRALRARDGEAIYYMMSRRARQAIDDVAAIAPGERQPPAKLLAHMMRALLLDESDSPMPRIGKIDQRNGEAIAHFVDDKGVRYGDARFVFEDGRWRFEPLSLLGIHRRRDEANSTASDSEK